MTKTTEPLEFKLSTPIKVSVGGDFVETDILELYSPPAKEKKRPFRLRKAFMAAIKSHVDKAGGSGEVETPGSNDETLKASDVEQMLFMSDIDIEEFMDNFATLIKVTGVCKVADTSFLSSHWDMISAEDATNLMGEYVAYFFIPSWIPSERT